jgi:hypothetical protein
MVFRDLPPIVPSSALLLAICTLRSGTRHADSSGVTRDEQRYNCPRDSRHLSQSVARQFLLLQAILLALAGPWAEGVFVQPENRRAAWAILNGQHVESAGVFINTPLAQKLLRGANHHTLFFFCHA